MNEAYEKKMAQGSIGRANRPDWANSADPGLAGSTGPINGTALSQACSPQTITSESEALLNHLSSIKEGISIIADKLLGPRDENNDAGYPLPGSLNGSIVMARSMASDIAREIQQLIQLI